MTALPGKSAHVSPIHHRALLMWLSEERSGRGGGGTPRRERGGERETVGGFVCMRNQVRSSLGGQSGS